MAVLTKQQEAFLEACQQDSKPLSILRSKSCAALRKMERQDILIDVVQPLEQGKLVIRVTYPNGRYGFSLTLAGEHWLKVAEAAEDVDTPMLQITPPRRYVSGGGTYVPPVWATR